MSASSRLGIDGEIKIESPDVDISGAWLILPAKFVDASGKLKPPCSALAPNPLQKTSGGKKDARQSVLKVVSSCRPDSSQATSSVIPEQLF